MTLLAVSSKVLSYFCLLFAYFGELLYSGSCKVTTFVDEVCTRSSTAGWVVAGVVVAFDGGGIAFAGGVVAFATGLAVWASANPLKRTTRMERKAYFIIDSLIN